MEQLISSLDKLLKYKNADPSRFYTYLANVTLSEHDEKYFTENFIPKVYYLYDKQILRKDLVYLSLLAGKNERVLQKFLDYDRSVFVLNINDPCSLFDYYVYEKKHWVCEIVNNPGYDKLIPLKNIYSKLSMIKYVSESNLPEVDINSLLTLSTQINLEVLDDFWKFYVGETHKFIDVVKFCKQSLNAQISDSELFSFASKNTLLDTLSKYADLCDSQHWEPILVKLKSGTHNERNVFTAFVIIATLVKLLIQDSYKSTNVNEIFEKVKTWLLELQNPRLQIESLENVFYLMFHRTLNEFTCKEKEIRFILCLLKSVIEEMQLKKKYEKGSEEHKRLTNLSDYVTDCLWRLDLIINTKPSPKIEEQLLSYMLAPPESLIHVCLKRRNFERARQVIEIFNLRDSDLAHEVNYAEVFLKFKKFLRKNGKQKVPVDKCVEEFFAENEPFTNIFDFALTQTKTWQESEMLLNLARKKFNLEETSSPNFLAFYKRITELANEVGPKEKLSIPEMLTSPKYPLDVQSYRTKEEFFEKLAHLYDEFQKQIQNHERGSFNRQNPSHKTFLKMNELCHKYVEEASVQYLLRTFNYLKAFSKVLYIEQNSSEIIANGKNTSFFDMLEFNRSELTGKLLFEKQLDPTEFEKYFGKLKLDFLYHVIGNCFPTINLHVQENVTVEELYHDNMLYVPSPSIIVYIQKRNWLLAFILSEMYKVEGVKIDISEVRLRTFFNYLKMPRIQNLKALFEGNAIIAALQNCISAKKLKWFFREQMVEHDLVSIQSHHSNHDVVDTAQEAFEDTDWKTLYDIVESVPENQMKKKAEMIFSKDNVLVNLVRDGLEPDFYQYAQFITERDLRIDMIFYHFKKWPGKFASDIIKSEVNRFDYLLNSKIEAMRDWLPHIELNEELKDVFDLKSWYKSYNFCKSSPECALNKILLTDQVDYLLNFIKLYKPPEEILTNISTNYLAKIMDLNVPLAKIHEILDNLPFEHAIDICHNLLTILRNLQYLQFVADYLNNNVSDDTFLKNAQITLKMLTVFTTSEQDQLFCLINEPLSILEVLLMNTKLDKLASILEILGDNFNQVLSLEDIDQLLRKYAEKSLDFRVITHVNPRLVTTPESKLLQSFDSLSLTTSDKKQFVVPDTVPTKDEWVPNDEVLECMCCRHVTFSMFNRRHHCRRCGRVICYNCSTKRMLVPTYGDIMVRVCSDCHTHTIGSAEGSLSRSLEDYWLLNDDPEHNQIIREEFSYEHAPSTSLCFSILKYHSKSVEYPKFLLQQCEVMLMLLQPNQEPTHEIDYLLVIKMLKSLATAAKMVSAENMLASGASMADRILSQAELLALLAERGCLNLMSSGHNLYVDASVLRRLRDKLLQREQWSLALEVSTKAGLDNMGVFAAWGKSCLKAGSLLVAREKFQRCLDKNSQYETASIVSSRLSDLNRSIDSLSISRSRLSSRISTSSNLSTSENKPIKDPPLLNEIIQILESKTRTIRAEVLERAKRIQISGSFSSLNQLTVHSDTAISVVNRIKNLQEVASGNLVLSQGKKINTSRPTIDPIFFEECVYYLSKYGTHLSLLEFFIRHGDIHTALVYIVENQLNPEVFVEVYMKCLKDGTVSLLQEQMSRIDSSLNLWKDYLKELCRHLEKQQLLNCLYQLQLYIGDYVRASMTCIRFYEDGVKSFTELSNNVGYLYKGEEHLRQVLEQEQWVEVASVGELSSASIDSFEERMLVNPELVLKIDTKDVNKHIKTVKRQVEVVNFLSQCESSGVNTRQLLKQLIAFKSEPNKKFAIPTLFGSPSDKINLCAMLIISNEDVEDGFKLATKIIEDFKLRAMKVYCLAAKHLAKTERFNGISQLVNCIKSTGINDSAVSDMLDEMLIQAVATLGQEDVDGAQAEELIKLIRDKAAKISAYIEAKQLKTAYFLAVKYKRTADIRRIQREAELLNMPTIKALCQKALASPQSHSKES